MVQPVMKDALFLSRKAQPATVEDLGVADDLMDTLRAHQEHCVGMAANMIGVNKRIIAFMSGPFCIVMFNPQIVSRRGRYQTEEGCLSLEGIRPAERYETIEVVYQDRDWKSHRMTYNGWIAQIIQHEVDHCEGILI